MTFFLVLKHVQTMKAYNKREKNTHSDKFKQEKNSFIIKYLRIQGLILESMDECFKFKALDDFNHDLEFGV